MKNKAKTYFGSFSLLSHINTCIYQYIKWLYKQNSISLKIYLIIFLWNTKCKIWKTKVNRALKNNALHSLIPTCAKSVINAMSFTIYTKMRPSQRFWGIEALISGEQGKISPGKQTTIWKFGTSKFCGISLLDRHILKNCFTLIDSPNPRWSALVLLTAYVC